MYQEPPVGIPTTPPSQVDDEGAIKAASSCLSIVVLSAPHEQGNSIAAPCTSDMQQAANDLWSKVYKQLPEESRQVGQTGYFKEAVCYCKTGRGANLAKRFKLNWGGKNIDVREKAEGFVAGSINSQTLAT
ncbi:hypothetical protein EV426DRAFT_700044 [Tirmania nivea]|nr:hypothetical protein EV426DRAFT_700044 [Tirmania nivea]